MKSSIAIILLAGLVLAGCSQKSSDSTAKLLANPVKGMRADELMVARQTSAAVLGARMHQEQDPGMQAVSEQMSKLSSGLDQRAGLLIQSDASQVPAGLVTKTSVATKPQIQQQLASNSSDLFATLSAARSSVDSIGAHGAIAGLPAKSMRAGVLASLDRIQADLTRISGETGVAALKDIRALQQRLAPAHRVFSAGEMTAPSIRVRVVPGVRG